MLARSIYIDISLVDEGKRTNMIALISVNKDVPGMNGAWRVFVNGALEQRLYTKKRRIKRIMQAKERSYPIIIFQVLSKTLNTKITINWLMVAQIAPSHQYQHKIILSLQLIPTH